MTDPGLPFVSPGNPYRRSAFGPRQQGIRRHQSDLLRECVNCGQPFRARRVTAAFCSQACRSQWRRHLDIRKHILMRGT